MSTTHSYPVDLRWTRDRLGELSSPELPDRIAVATPPEFAQGMPGIWSPEHLYTAAISSCLMTTFLAIAENSKLAFTDFQCGAEGVLAQVEGKYRMTEVHLRPVLTLPAGTDPDKALRVLEKAERSCLITNSVSAVVTMEPTIRVGAAADN